jgi:hypothetical protein
LRYQYKKVLNGRKQPIRYICSALLKAGTFFATRFFWSGWRQNGKAESNELIFEFTPTPPIQFA